MKRVLGAATALLVMVGLTVSSQAATLANPMVFGAFPGAATKASTLAMETNVSRSLAYVRVYRSWDDSFPDTNVTWMRTTSHSLFLSIKARLKNGTNVPWAEIANAKPGDARYATMQRWAAAIKGYGKPIYVSFNHEPDTANSQASGTSSQYVAAWQKFVTVMRAEGVTNASWAWTVAARSFLLAPTDPRYAPNYYPGDNWVDDIALDVYNIYCQRKDGSFANPWRSLATLLGPFMTFVASHPGPHLVVAEWGTVEDPANPTRKAQWIADAQQLFKQPGYERFSAISYWNHSSHNYANCDFSVTSSPASLAAFKTMARDPFYAGTVQ